MESKINVFSPEHMTELLELLENAEAVPLVISGDSMSPFLAPGRDTVYLSRIKRQLKRGDMVLYKRSSGAYILHRIYRTDGEHFEMIGDARRIVEKGIGYEQLLAVVTAVKRKGRIIDRRHILWFFFEKVWIRMVPVRRMIVLAAAGIKKTFGR